MPLSRVATLNFQKNIPRNMLAFRKKHEFCGKNMLYITDNRYTV